MTDIAKRIQQRLQSLPARRAARLEHLLGELLDFSEAEAPERQPSNRIQQKAVRTTPYQIKARNLGLRPGLSYDNIGELLTEVEGEDWR